MGDYRVYLLDDGGSILKSSDVECADDTSANSAARELLEDGAQAEIWQGTRLL